MDVRIEGGEMLRWDRLVIDGYTVAQVKPALHPNLLDKLNHLTHMPSEVKDKDEEITQLHAQVEELQGEIARLEDLIPDDEK